MLAATSLPRPAAIDQQPRLTRATPFLTALFAASFEASFEALHAALFSQLFGSGHERLLSTRSELRHEQRLEVTGRRPGDLDNILHHHRERRDARRLAEHDPHQAHPPPEVRQDVVALARLVEQEQRERAERGQHASSVQREARRLADLVDDEVELDHALGDPVRERAVPADDLA